MNKQSTCEHHCLYLGMCVNCGKAVFDGEKSRVPLERDFYVSEKQANQLSHESTSSRLQNHRLALILDLDETLINTISVDDNNNEEESSSTNNNNKEKEKQKLISTALTEQHFKAGVQLHEFTFVGKTHYFATRPKLFDFLNEMKELYDLHLYSFGNQAYVERVLQVIDPVNRYFKQRIITRDTVPELSSEKSSMIVLPAEAEDNKAVISLMKQLLPTMGSISSLVIVDDRFDVWDLSSDNLIQIEPWRVFKKPSDPVEISISSPDDDNILELTGLKLKRLHSEFFKHYDTDHEREADVPSIMKSIRGNVLLGTKLCFSGVVPIAFSSTQLSFQWVMQHNLVLMEAHRLGAVCVECLTSDTTHLVAKRPGTSKVLEAEKMSNVHIVTLDWLLQAIRTWTRPPEHEYPLKGSTKRHHQSSTASSSHSQVQTDGDISSLQNNKDNTGITTTATTTSSVSTTNGDSTTKKMKPDWLTSSPSTWKKAKQHEIAMMRKDNDDDDNDEEEENDYDWLDKLL